MFRDGCGARADRGSVPVRFVIGLAVVALGVLFLGDNLGLFEARPLLHAFWPLFFVAIGLTVLTQPRARGRSRAWGAVWVLAGAWIWAQREGWVTLEFWDLFFPALLVVAGGSLVWRSLAGPRPRRAELAAEGDAVVDSFAFMSGYELRSNSQAFRGGDLGALMGGITLDLTQAKIAGDEAVLELFVWWGGIQVRVPPDWAVVSQVRPFMAGFEDKTRPSSAAPTRRLLVRGLAVMGGVEVGN